MDNKIKVFSSKAIEKYNENTFNSIVEKGSKLTRMALDRYHRGSAFAPMSFSVRVNDNEYSEANKTIYECVIKYCADKANIENIANQFLFICHQSSN
jgi:hypothetical protein